METYTGKKEGSCSETRDEQLLRVLTAGMWIIFCRGWTEVNQGVQSGI